MMHMRRTDSGRAESHVTRRTVDGKTGSTSGAGWLPAWVPGLCGWFGIVFGALTVVAATSVLLGLRGAGYPVFRPLLIFNTVMGPFYVLAGALILARRRAGRRSAGLIGLINLGVLAAVVAVPGVVARQSVAAMTVRTTVWLVIYAALTTVPPRRVGDPG